MSDAAAEKEATATSVGQAVGNPSDDINRIIIGLGGQGSRVVNEVRKEVQKLGPLRAGIEFVAIDSDRISLSNLDSVPENQRIYLAAPEDEITETIVPWLPHEFRPKAGGGCGMQRLTGKAMYLVHRHRILEAVRDVARELRQRTQVSNFMVVLVNAFGGGTGSGMAIELSIDLRKDLKEITGQDPVMFGMGILPSRSETIQRANGVAMLKELHFLLSHKEPVVIGGRDYSSPFELFFLTGREVMGIERDEDLLNSIVRFTIDLGLIPSTSRDNAAAGKGAGWVDLQDIRTLVKGAGHMFSTFGYYRAAFPADELKEYFDLLDWIAALQKEMPGSATDLDAYRRELEDKKIAIAHREEALQRAKDRAARLRSDGILGANRPELAKLLAETHRLEDSIRKLKREVEAAEKQLPALADKRETVEDDLRELQARADALKQELLAPAQSRTNFTVPLSEPEIEHLQQNRHLLEASNFRSMMDLFGRMPTYDDKTMEVVGKNKILYLPLLNYRMSFHTASEFPPRILAALRAHGFVRFDKAGNPTVSDDHLWMIMAMLASSPDNIDASKVAARAFKELVEGHVARRAEVKIVPSKSKRWEVVIHSWMVGLQVAPIAPGYPPRLKDLEWLTPEYEQVAREGSLAQHHAFLYGDPLAFAKLASVPVDRISVERTHELVTEFWRDYAPIDGEARWLQLPPVLAEAMVAAQEVAEAANEISEAADEFRASGTTFGSVDRLSAALAQGTQGLEGFGRGVAEDEHPLQERLSTLVLQLDRSRTAPRDTERMIAMEELAAEALEAVSLATDHVKDLRAGIPATVATALAAARAAEQPPGDAHEGVRSVVRWQHTVADAESRAAALHDATGSTLRHLEHLERALTRVQETLRARSLAALPGKMRRPKAPLIEMEAGAHGNGHHVREAPTDSRRAPAGAHHAHDDADKQEESE